MSSVDDWFDNELCWIAGHSYQIIESSFSQKFYYASLRDCLKERPQWVNCVVLIRTFLQHCTFQEYVLICQRLATLLTSSWWSSGQDIGFCGLGMAVGDSYSLLNWDTLTTLCSITTTGAFFVKCNVNNLPNKLYSVAYLMHIEWRRCNTSIL